MLATFAVHTQYMICLYSPGTFVTTHMVWCVVLQVPLEVVTAATLRPKNGVFVKYEARNVT